MKMLMKQPEVCRSAVRGVGALCLLCGFMGSLYAAEMPPVLPAVGTPPLIPTPRKSQWTGGAVDCSRYQISAPAEAGPAEAALRRVLAGAKMDAGGTSISLHLGAIAEPNPEAYTLDVLPTGISITASKPAGLFYGVQTLRQLLAGTTRVPCCRISDWPAFPLRGFMHDTGRNFQTLDSLKDQLDLFAAYKLNVFHWHLTDNPGWRVESKLFPQLNRAEFQTRDQGMVYSYAGIRDLIRHARDLHITVIPELDMPGHSESFGRAMGFKMASEQGMAALEQIIDEFCTEIPATDCPWLHLGSDEVNIANPREFMERMLKRVRANGREAIIWSPGLPGDTRTVMQLWQDNDTMANGMKSGGRFVSSATGYLNNSDPLELVQRYFFRPLYGASSGNDKALGGILCCWPDVRVADKSKIFRHNPVWPGMLAFSESIWHGAVASRPQFLTALPPQGSPAWNEFREFEIRLAYHRDHYFSGRPFPFVKTSQIAWQLVGPFYRSANESCSKSFPPEKSIAPNYIDDGITIAWNTATGGTLTNMESRMEVEKKRRRLATAYAYTRVFSDSARNIRAWIGFETPDRDNRRCGGIPPAGEWSPFGAMVWINDAPLPAPHWQQPGQNRYLDYTWSKPANEIPYVDEEFYWTREPATCHLNAGWNKVLLRIPCGYGGQKWSFTFIPVKMQPPDARWVEDESVRFSAELK